MRKTRRRVALCALIAVMATFAPARASAQEREAKRAAKRNAS